MTHDQMIDLLARRQDTIQPAMLDRAAIERLERYRGLLFRANEALRFYNLEGSIARKVSDEIREAIQ
jgi:hypothetical protein